MERMKRDVFFAKVGGLDADRLRHVLWNLYHRGGSALRERIEGLLDPDKPGRGAVAREKPDASFLREEAEEFCRHARSGAYMGGTRDVSPSERIRWRHTFRRLVDSAVWCLGHGEFEEGAGALDQLLGVLCEASDIDYFHSEDAVQAAKLVVSDVVRTLWKASLEHEGFPAFAHRAAPQLLRWERAFGWTRYGEGAVADKETPLASVLAGLLTLLDMWVTLADSYLRALDAETEASGRAQEAGAAHWPHVERNAREERTRNLARWHGALLERLAGTDGEDRLDGLVQHPALDGPEKTFLQARLAHARSDAPRARALATRCLESLPGHEGFLAFADSIGGPVPASAKRVRSRR
jgi:hypothetical protein